MTSIKMIAVFMYCFLGKTQVFSQTDIKIIPGTTEFKLSVDVIHRIDLTITNNTTTEITIPAKPVITDKKIADEHALGVSYKLVGHLKKIKCYPNIDHILGVTIPMETIKPGETKTIHASLAGLCLHEKGKYKITFFIKNPRATKAKKHRHLSCNSIIIHLV